jgi:wobble nucleotide-excising tRNase
MTAIIKRFRKINAFGSFHGYTPDTGLPPFTEVNILYGRNYAGKTTLSRILRSFETQRIPNGIENPSFELEMSDGTTLTESTLSSAACVRVFNQDFVRENLHFIGNPTDTGVTPFAILGANNTELQSTIDQLERQLGSSTPDTAEGLRGNLRRLQLASGAAETTLRDLTTELERDIAEKATNRTTGIRYQSARYGDQNYNRQKLQNELELVVSPGYNPLCTDEVHRLESLPGQPTLDPLALFAAQPPEIARLTNAASQLITKSLTTADKIQELIANVALNQWVHAGLNFHQGPQEQCKFCGEKISPGRWAELGRHFDEESQNLRGQIDSLIGEILSERLRLQDITAPPESSVYPQFQAARQEAETAVAEWRNVANAAMASLLKQLEQRREQIHVPLRFVAPQVPFQPFAVLVQKINAVIRDSNAYTSQIATDQNSARSNLRLQEVWNFANQIGYASRTEQILDARNELQRLRQQEADFDAQIAALEQQIRDLRGQMSDETAGARAVNRYLQHSFGHRELSLQVVAETHETAGASRFQVCRNGVPALHLSEGESSLIAFCYFVARLQSVDNVGHSPIIWIDDPICSLDGNHIFFIFSLLDAEVVKPRRSSQLFVSTHSLEFLRYLQRLHTKYTGNDGIGRTQQRAWFLVSRSAGSSKVLPLPTSIKEYATEFSHLFEQVCRAAEVNPADDESHRQLYSFGNDLRKFLEIFLYYRFPDKTFDFDVLQEFFECPVKAALINRIVNEFSHLVGRIERGGVPVDVPELIDAAKCVLEAIKRDTVQYHSLLRSVGRTPPI